MRKKLRSGRYVVLSTLGVWIIGCSLEADLPSRNGGPAPASTAVTVSGAGARDDADAAVGAGSRITDIHMQNGDSHASDDPEGTDHGGAFDEGAGGTGGAASKTAGAAGVGGKASRSTSKSSNGGASSGNAGKDGAGSGNAGKDGAGSGNAGNAGSGGAEKDTPPDPPVLWFSEYIEGSSSNKALEITALTHSVLDGCKVSTYFNGKTEPTVVATLSGALEAGQVLTLCTSSLKDKLADTCNQVGNLTFNGDDTIALSCSGTILDVVGQIGVDPGDAWGSEMNSTMDHTLRRNCAVQTGDPLGADVFEPNLEWQAFPVDSFDGLGSRGC
jgi:hypothetical protein